jgi:GT2 family glycosyltransferase
MESAGRDRGPPAVSARSDGLVLTAVVPATNAPPTLDRCVAAIRSARASPEEIVVVDGPAGAGPAVARNEGARRARGDVLVFVDADVVVHEDAFVHIRKAFADEAALTALFGSYDDRPEAQGAVSGFRNLLHHQVHQEAAGPVRSFWAGLGAVRRRAFLAVGGFDAERFPRASVEDVEFGMRLAGNGNRIRLAPEVLGTHLKSWTVAEMVRTDLLHRGIPWVRLLVQERSAPAELNLAWRHRAGTVLSLAAVAALLRRRPVTAAAALAGLVGVNAPFYRLLVRRRGAAEAAQAVALHVLHHIVGAAAVPIGLVAHARSR